MTRARRPQTWHAILAAILLTLSLAPFSQHVTTAQEGDETVTPVSLQVTPGEVADEEQRWVDEGGLHIRDLVVEAAVEGDLSGAASVTVDLDWAGPCEPDEQTCEGALELLGEVDIASEEGSWDGLIALEGQGLDSYSVHSILIGRGTEAGRAIVIDIAEADDMATLTFGGTAVDLGNRRGGGKINQYACVTGEERADGAFLSNGLIGDDGPVNLTLIGVGAPSQLGRYGQARHQGKNGTFQTSYIEQSNGPHAFGAFAMAGATGAYSEIAGFGYTRSTVSDNSDCASGKQIVTTWTGEFHYVTDPAAFLRPRVAFSYPASGDRLNNPVIVQAIVENFDLQTGGDGYLHLMIEAPCIEPGEIIPEDDAHVRLPQGETSIELNLVPSKYRLCLQLADGEGRALPYTAVITFRVVPSESTLSMGLTRE